MQQLSLLDKWLLAILVPFCVGIYSLHVWSVVHRDLANAAIYAAPPQSGSAYPVVGGLYPESQEALFDLEVGDRLLRIEGMDLRGVGYARFDGLLLEAASEKEWVELEFERDGRVGRVSLRAIPFPMPWHRVPMLVSLFLVGTIVMLRGRSRRQARLVFVGFLGLSIVLAQFRGGPSWMTEFGLFLRLLWSPLAFAFAIASMSTVPDPKGRPTRMALLICLASATFSFAMRLGYHVETPIPASLVPRGVLLSDAFAMIAILTAPRWRSFPIAVPSACTIAAAPMLAGSILPVFLPESNLAAPLHAVGYFALALIPMVLMTRIVADGLFDVDRILSATATYTLVVIIAVGALLGLIPSLALGVSAISGLSPQIAQWATALCLALVLVPLTPRLRARVERFFFPERMNFAEGIEALRARLDECHDDGDVVMLLGEGFGELLRVEHCRAYLRRGKAFYRCYSTVPPDSEGDRSPPTVDSARPVETLDGVTSAVRVDDSQRTTFDLFERSELTDLGIRVVVPIHRGADLVGFLCLGQKRSGDAFSDLELSRLTATADRASARLQRVQTERLANEVEAADKEILSRSRFMANASHDLRQPLQALSLFAGALAKRHDGPQAEDLARNIGRSTDALREMFEGLLDLSRIEVGEVSPIRGRVPLAPIFERLESELAPLATKKGLRLRVAPTTLAVESDPALLGRILQNLTVNAIRYTEEGGVLLGARRRGGHVHIEVVDTGTGIPESHRERIFEEFERVGGQSRISEEGLGLGLAIVSRLAQQLEHRIDLTSELGQGSRFSIVAPRSQSAREDLPPSVLREGASGLEGRSILVLDDDANVRTATRSLLESWGCRVETSERLAALPEALERLDGSLDLVIADYRLGEGETGIEGIRELRAMLGRSVPAIVVTGDSVRKEEMETDGLPVLIKPVAPPRLRSLLAHLLRTDSP